MASKKKSKKVAKKKSVKKCCSLCGRPGHNSRTCTA